MTKQEKIYRIFMTTMIVIIAGLLLATGIIAVQKSMKLSVGVSITPSMLCKITDSSNNVLFCNTTKNGQSLYVGEGFSASGTMLTLNKAFNGVAGEFSLKIYNYTTVATSGNVIKVTASGTGVETTSMWLPSYSSGTPTAGEINVTAVAGSITLQFEEVAKPSFTITYNLTGCTTNQTSGASVNYGTSYSATITPTTGYLRPSTITVANISTGGYSWDYSTGVFTITDWTKVNGNITITVAALPYTIGTYVATDGTTPGYKVNDNTVYFPAFDGYKYIEIEGVEYPQTYKAGNVTITAITSGSEGTTGAIGTGSDGYKYYYQKAMQYQYKSGSTHQFSTTYGVSGWYKIEPIRWIIIGGNADTSTYGAGAATDKDGLVPGELLLLSERVLYGVPFDGSHYTSSSSYQNIYYNGQASTSSDVWCSINGWTGSRGDSNSSTNNGVDYINQADALHVRENYFIKLSGLEALMENYPDLIVEKTLSTTYKGGTDSSPHEIFLLGGTGSDSFLYSKYLGSSGDQRLIGYASGFAHATSAYASDGAQSSESRASFWWLRSGYSSYADHVYVVGDDGNVYYDFVGYSNLGVRPCFILNLA